MDERNRCVHPQAIEDSRRLVEVAEAKTAELTYEEARNETAFMRLPSEEEEKDQSEQHQGELIQRPLHLLADERMHDGEQALMCVTSALCLPPGSCFSFIQCLL